MIWLSPVTRYTLAREACTLLFQLHQSEQSELQSLDKIRTRRQRLVDRDMRRELHLQQLRRSKGKTSHTVSRSSSVNTTPTSTTQFQITVTSLDGQIKGSFSGTRSHLYSEVALFLMTGKSGVISQERSSTDYRRKVLSLLSSEMSPPDTSTGSTSATIESSEPATLPPEEYGQAKPHSQGRVFGPLSTPDWENLNKNRYVGD